MQNIKEELTDDLEDSCQKPSKEVQPDIFEVNTCPTLEKFTLKKQQSCFNAFSRSSDFSEESDRCKLSSVSYYECMKLDKRHSTSVQRQTQESVSYSLKGEMSVLIFYKQYDDECKFIVKDISELLFSLNCNVYLEKHQFEEIKEMTHSNRLIVLNKDHIPLIALIIVVGGDGTVLYALRQFQKQEPPPILAFQKGTLGFMCVFELKNKNEIISKQIDHFKTSGQFVVERKLRLEGVLLEGDVKKMEYHVLNEFVITRGANPSCLYMEIYINDVLLTVASGDGIIVSTPTGSTAYFLSAGGPIIQNEVSSISIAPICPLSLSFRPIVLPTCLKITIKLAKQCRANGFICADGQITEEFTKDMTLQIQKSENTVSVIQDKPDIDYNDWIVNLRKKLSWNKVFTDQKKNKSNL